MTDQEDQNLVKLEQGVAETPENDVRIALESDVVNIANEDSGNLKSEADEFETEEDDSPIDPDSISVVRKSDGSSERSERRNDSDRGIRITPTANAFRGGDSDIPTSRPPRSNPPARTGYQGREENRRNPNAGDSNFRRPQSEGYTRPSAPSARPAPAASQYTRQPSHNSGFSNFFAFDIETVPCLETARRLLKIDATVADAEVFEKLKTYHLEITNGQNEFFRQPFHKIVCVSFLVGSITIGRDGKERYSIKQLKTGGRNGESESEIISSIFNYLSKSPARLISFNGRTFDLPVLQYRAMKHGLSAEWIYKDGLYNYNHRFSVDKHFDLLDAISNFGASARVRMSEFASLTKVPCKVDGSGSEVYDMYKNGKIQDICNYCETDVLATYVMYLKFMHHSGKLTTENLVLAFNDIISKFRDDVSAQEHQKKFVSDWLEINDGSVTSFAEQIAE